jgi:soluble P-type ATPase
VRDQAELRRKHDVVATLGQGAADELLVRQRAVDLRGVDEGDAQLKRPLDGADRLGLAAVRVEVVAGHRHRAEPDPRDVESTE